MRINYPNPISDGNYNDYNCTSNFVLVFSMIGLFSIIISKIFLRTLRISMSWKVLLFAGAVLVAFLSFHIKGLEFLKDHTQEYPIQHLFIIYLPIMLLKVMYLIDRRPFHKFLPVLLVLSLSPTICGLLCGLTMKAMHVQWTYQDCILHGMIFTTTQPFSLINLLNHNSSLKLVNLYLSAESILAIFWLMPIVKHVNYSYDKETIVAVDILWIYLMEPLGGLLLGFAAGKMLVIPLKYMVMQTDMIFSLLVFFSILTYVIATEIRLSGYSALMCMVLIIFAEKHRFMENNDNDLHLLIEVVYRILDGGILVYGVIKFIIYSFKIVELHYYLFGYAVLMSLRFCSLMLGYPLMKAVHSEMTLQKILLMTLVYPTSTISIILSLSHYYKRNTHDVAEFAMGHVLFNEGTTLLLNNFLILNLLKFSDTGSVSQEKVKAMTEILKVLKECRDDTISYMRMYREYSDVNWPIVRKYAKCVVSHPYPKIDLDWETIPENMDEMRKKRTTNYCCVDCPFMPDRVTHANKAEINYSQILITEMNLNVARQREHCLISTECEEVIKNVIQMYGKKTSEQRLEILRVLSKRKAILELLKKLMKYLLTRKYSLPVPRKIIRKFCYYLIHNKFFQVFLYTCIILSLLPILGGIINLKFYIHIEKYVNIFLAILFVFEFIVTVMAYSSVSVSTGIKIYFKSFWHWMDFVSMIGMIFEAIQDWLPILLMLSPDQNKIIKSFAWLKSLRFFRLLKLLSTLLPKILLTIESEMDARLTLAYEATLGMNNCIDEMLLNIDRYKIDIALKTMIIRDLKSDKRILLKLLIKSQMEIPWITHKVKTFSMIDAGRSCINDYLTHLNFEGAVDVSEYEVLMKIIWNKKRHAELLQNLPAVSPVNLFYSLYWITESSSAADYLKGKSVLRKFPAKSIIFNKGDLAEGVYLLVAGVIRIVYDLADPDEPLDPSATEYMEFHDAYITIGNSLGEIAFLTRGRHEYSAITEVDCRFYYMDSDSLYDAIDMQPHPIYGLEASIWKHKTANFVVSLLMNHSIYKYYGLWEIRKLIQQSFVPNLSCYKVFVRIDLITDIVLLYGKAIDERSNTLYRAPIFIPRTVQKLILPKSDRKIHLSTRLLIIPNLNVDPVEIMSIEESVCKMYAHDLHRCNLHVSTGKALQKHTVHSNRGIVKTATAPEKKSAVYLGKFH